MKPPLGFPRAGTLKYQAEGILVITPLTVPDYFPVSGRAAGDTILSHMLGTPLLSCMYWIQHVRISRRIGS